MDPLSAVSLAGNIIQFVEFGSSLVHGSLDLYSSTDGASSVNSELELLAEDLMGICTKLIRPRKLMEERQLPKAELDLLRLSRSCITLGSQFVAVLEGLNVKGQNRKWESVRQALKTQWKVKDVDRYQQRLDSYRAEIAVHLLSMLRYCLVIFSWSRV